MDISTKEKKVKLVVTAVLGALIIYASIYILLFNYLIPKKTDADAENEILSVEDQKLLSELVPYIKNTMDSSGNTGVYDTIKVDNSNINSTILFNIAYAELSKDDGNFVESDADAYLAFKNQNCKTENDKCFVIYRASLEGVIARNYKDIEYEWTDFQIKNNKNDICKYINGEYYCHVSLNAGEDTIKKVSTVALAKVDGENYYIYEKALFLIGYSETKTDTGYTIHADDIYKYYRNDNYGFNESVDITSSDENYASELIKKYDNKVQIFKSTFKKDRTGNYIWVSTEPVSVIGE